MAHQKDNVIQNILEIGISNLIGYIRKESFWFVCFIAKFCIVEYVNTGVRACEYPRNVLVDYQYVHIN